MNLGWKPTLGPASNYDSSKDMFFSHFSAKSCLARVGLFFVPIYHHLVGLFPNNFYTRETTLLSPSCTCVSIRFAILGGPMTLSPHTISSFQNLKLKIISPWQKPSGWTDFFASLPTQLPCYYYCYSSSSSFVSEYSCFLLLFSSCFKFFFKIILRCFLLQPN